MAKQPASRKTPEQIRQSHHDNIGARFGASLPEWMTRIRATGTGKHSESVNWLKAEHNVGHSHAALLAHDAVHRPDTGESSTG